jgi:hypothetical protein
MSEASPSFGGHPATRLPHYAVADRVVGDRTAQQNKSGGSRDLPPSQDPVDYSGMTVVATGAGPRPHGTSAIYERGGYGGTAPTPTTEYDSTDLTDLSHSLGDGARYAVEIGQARQQANTPATGVAKLRLRQALYGIRRVCEQAMRQRMHTEMADLASQIRKMHDRDTSAR